MDFSAYLRMMGVATAIAWLGWVFVLFRIDPLETGALGIILFYSTLFLSLVGTLATGGTFLRSRLLKTKEILSREVRIAFRHAVLVSIAGIFCLFLAAEALLTWWNFLGIFVGVGIMEYLFLTLQEGRRS